MRNLTLLKLFLGLMLLLLAGCTPQAAPTTSATLTLSECVLTAPGVSVRQTAQCANLPVPEDPDDPSSRMIDLHIAVIPAVSRSPAPDPLFFLTGGPGQAASESYLLLSTAFERMHQKRDIVLVDQRGTGKSNPLTCPEVSDEEAEDMKSVDFARQCMQSIEADLAAYTTANAARDLDAARTALGYTQINLYGLSYGTRLAQTYLQMFPDQVRAIILDGVVPQDQALGLYVARDAQHALDQIFARCQSDPDCNATFPDLSAEFDDLLVRLANQAAQVQLPDPVSGEIITQTLSTSELGSAVRLLSYSPETVALLPLLIHTTAVNQDYTRLAAQYRIVAGQLSETISEPLSFSVLCAEDQPFFDPLEAAEANHDTYLGDQQTDALNEICAIWPSEPPPEGFKTPVQSDVPVLLLSGEADPVTPPSNADQVSLGLPNSLHLIVPELGHNVIYRGCLPWLAADFIEAASVDGLDATCVEQIAPMPFFLNFSGPAQVSRGKIP